MKRYTNEHRQSEANGFIYGWQKARAHGKTPACYHVGTYGRGCIRTYDGGTKEAIYETGHGIKFHVSDMFLTESEAEAWLSSKGAK
jgi:hypothetical protein